jgi:predicted Rossmann fold nucleotide-binding protein DprA/Smf involved in DNA uptake
LLFETAQSQGKELPGFMRDIAIAYCQNRLNFSSEPVDRSDITIKQSEIVNMISELQSQIKELKDLYEIDLQENLDSFQRLEVKVDESDRDRVIAAINFPLFLDQICERTRLTPKVVIKILSQLKKEEKVSQSPDMKWRLI